MSFNSSRRRALNQDLPLGCRTSHARSCAMLVGQKWRVKRSTVLQVVQEKCGVDLSLVKTDHEIATAIAILEELRHNWTGTESRLKQELQVSEPTHQSDE